MVVWAVCDGLDDSEKLYGPFDDVQTASVFQRELEERLHENGREWYVYLEDVLPATLPPREEE